MTPIDVSAGFSAADYLTLDLDSLLARAVVSLVDPDNDALVGTGFFITPWEILTCYHVGSDVQRLEVHGSDGRPLAVGSIERGQALRTANSEIDLALIRLSPIDGPGPGNPLPLAMRVPVSPVLLGRAGAPASLGYAGTSPFKLQVIGSAWVRYRKDESASIEALDLEGPGVRPGASGSPLLDVSYRAVVAVVVGGNPDPGVQRTWAVQMSAVCSWKGLAEAAAWNDRFIPRLGLALNGAATAVLFELHRIAMRATLLRETRFEVERDVRRQVAEAGLREFLRSSLPLVAIVGPSNVGKSWMLASFFLREETASGSGSILPVFYEARAIAPGAVRLSELLRGTLTQVMAERYPALRGADAVPDTETTLSVMRAAGQQLVVVLDGLNEAPDVFWFSSVWLREAVGWAQEKGVRLVLSCRMESWPTLAETAQLTGRLFHVQGVADEKGRSLDPADWCHVLSDFSPEESRWAAEQYGLSPQADVGAHPLMYRIAKVLNERLTEALGRFQVLELYVQKQLSIICTKLGRGPAFARQLRGNLQRLADQLPAAGEGGVPLETAGPIVGDVATLDVLVTEGFLSETAQYVRFRHDQLADALRTVRAADLEGWTACADPALNKEQTEQRLASATVALLRFEAQGAQSDYARGIELLLNALADEDNLLVCSYADRVGRSLPPARVADVERIYTAFASSQVWWSGTARSIAEAPLGLAVRVRLLLRVSGRGPLGDRSGHPVRWQDWSSPSRRHAFVESLREHFGLKAAQAYLNDFLLAFRDDVRPLLLEALDDETPIGNEASISSLSAGILFVNARADFGGLFTALLERSTNSSKSRKLLRELLDEYPDLVVPEVLAHLGRGGREPAVVDLLCSRQEHDPAEDTRALVGILFEEALQPQSELQSKLLMLAELVRRDEPDDLRAWDVLTEHPQPYGSLGGSVPAQRLAMTLQRIESSGLEFARYVLGEDESPPEIQAQFVAAVRRLPPRRLDWHSLGSLLEKRLEHLDGSAAIEPWMGFAREVAVGSNTAARKRLISNAFHPTYRKAWTLELRRLFLQTARSDDIAEFARQLMDSNEPIAEWGESVTLLRNGREALADQGAWKALQQRLGYASHEALQRSADLVELWRAEGATTPTARYVSGRLEAGIGLEEVLSEQVPD